MATKKAEDTEDPRLKKLIRVYLKMKAKRDEITEAFKVQEKELAEQMDKVKAALLDYCNETGLEGARTTEGVFWRTASTNYYTNDWESFHAFVVQHNVPQLLEKRLHQGNTKQFIEEHPDLPLPGLVPDSKYSITISKRRS